MDQSERTEDFKTSCRSCIFAEIEDNTQLDCELGRLETYIQRGKAQIQNDGTYIIDTICNACRGVTWMKQQPYNENLIASVEREIQIALSFVLVSMNDDPDTILTTLGQRLSNCVNQKLIAPKQIIVVIKSLNAINQEMYDIIADYCGDIPFKLVKIVDNTCDIDRCVDLGVQHVRSRYYCVSYLTHSIPLTLISALNNLINYELRSVSMIKPICGYSGLVVQNMLHKIFGGNRVMPLYEKVIEAAQLQDKLDNILSWEELWNNQK